MCFAHGNPRSVCMPFSNESSAAAAFVQLTFLSTAAKSKQKGPLDGDAFYPTIYLLLHVVMIRSLRGIT